MLPSIGATARLQPRRRSSWQAHSSTSAASSKLCARKFPIRPNRWSPCEGTSRHHTEHPAGDEDRCASSSNFLSGAAKPRMSGTPVETAVPDAIEPELFHGLGSSDNRRTSVGVMGMPHPDRVSGHLATRKQATENAALWARWPLHVEKHWQSRHRSSRHP